MNKKILFVAVSLISLTVALVPVRQADAFVCGIPCLLQMGGQAVNEAGTRIKAILGTLQQQAMSWLEDANSWMSKYTGLAWSNKTEKTKNDPTPMKDLKAPNLADKGVTKRTSAAASVSFKTRNEKGEMVTVEGPKPTEKIETQAEKVQTALLSTRGTLQGMREESARKNYTAQQDAIDALAMALVVKGSLEDMKKLGDEMDLLKASIVPNQVPSAAPITGTQNADTTAQAGAAPKDRSVTTALRDNLQVRLLWDSLLTTQQQIVALRLKTETLRAMENLDDVGKMGEIEEIKRDDSKAVVEGTN